MHENAIPVTMTPTKGCQPVIDRSVTLTVQHAMDLNSPTVYPAQIQTQFWMTIKPVFVIADTMTLMTVLLHLIVRRVILVERLEMVRFITTA